MNSLAAQHPNGDHHIAFMAGDMKKQLEFFTQVLGFPLVAIFDMHGVEGAVHAFLRMSDHRYFSLVYIPGGDKIPSEIGVTHCGRGDVPCAPGVMQHVAFNVPDEAALYEMRDRIRSYNVPVFGPIDHGFCKSLYFAGPEQMTLEIATSYKPLDPEHWIDDAALEKMGIPAELADRMQNPAPYSGHSPVAQPSFESGVLHLVYPADRYREMLATPDSVYESRAPFAPPKAPK